MEDEIFIVAGSALCNTRKHAASARCKNLMARKRGGSVDVNDSRILFDHIAIESDTSN